MCLSNGKNLSGSIRYNVCVSLLTLTILMFKTSPKFRAMFSSFPVSDPAVSLNKRQSAPGLNSLPL